MCGHSGQSRRGCGSSRSPPWDHCALPAASRAGERRHFRWTGHLGLKSGRLWRLLSVASWPPHSAPAPGNSAGTAAQAARVGGLAPARRRARNPQGGVERSVSVDHRGCGQCPGPLRAHRPSCAAWSRLRSSSLPSHPRWGLHICLSYPSAFRGGAGGNPAAASPPAAGRPVPSFSCLSWHGTPDGWRARGRWWGAPRH